MRGGECGPRGHAGRGRVEEGEHECDTSPTVIVAVGATGPGPIGYTVHALARRSDVISDRRRPRDRRRVKESRVRRMAGGASHRMDVLLSREKSGDDEKKRETRERGRPDGTEARTYAYGGVRKRKEKKNTRDRKSFFFLTRGAAVRTEENFVL